jgi:hypothetical protein
MALSLQPATLVVAPEDEFTITIALNSGQKPVDGAQIALAFDPARLTVLSLTPGAALPDVFQQTYDNTQGRVLYAAGKMLGELPKGQLELFRVRFRALSVGACLIEFAADPPLPTKVTSGGENLALELAASQITIGSGSSIVATPTDVATQIQQATATLHPTQSLQVNTPAPTNADSGYPAPSTPTTPAQAATPTTQPTATRTALALPSFTATRPLATTPLPGTATPGSAVTQVPITATLSRLPVATATIIVPSPIPSRPPVATAIISSPTALPSLPAMTPIAGELSATNTPILAVVETELESRSPLGTILSISAIIAIAALVIAFAFVRRRWLSK